jgi:hypothetical protein
LQIREAATPATLVVVRVVNNQLGFSACNCKPMAPLFFNCSRTDGVDGGRTDSAAAA